MDVLLAAVESVRTAEITQLHLAAGKIHKLHVKRKRGVFRCDECASVFGLRHNLMRHQRTIHRRQQAPLQCAAPGCGARFSAPVELEAHVAVVHKRSGTTAGGGDSESAATSSSSASSTPLATEVLDD